MTFSTGGLLVEFPLLDCPLHDVFSMIVECDFNLLSMKEEYRASAKVRIFHKIFFTWRKYI